MEIIINNESNVLEENVTEVVKRVKALIINSKNEILLAYSANIYQFPGGHVEEDEELNMALEREIKEETGIIINGKDLKPFACIISYYKDWPEKGMNRKNEIYYYEIRTDELPDLDQTNYTEEEKRGNFELKYVNLNEVERVLNENINKYGDIKGIASEMLKILNIYEDR